MQMSREFLRDLSRSGVAARAVEKPSKPGERGDAFSLGQLAIDLVTSGSLASLLQFLKVYLERDKTLRFEFKKPDGTDVEMTAKNIDNAEVREELKLLLSKDT